jgi:hypothetical protein
VADYHNHNHLVEDYHNHPAADLQKLLVKIQRRAVDDDEPKRNVTENNISEFA